jgi:hypothetical protein
MEEARAPIAIMLGAGEGDHVGWRQPGFKQGSVSYTNSEKFTRL